MLHARSDYDGIQPWPQKRPPVEKYIPYDEPVFVIRAQDRCALEAMDAWIGEAIWAGVDKAMIDCVREHRELMAQWQDEHGSKIPDVPQGMLRRQEQR